MLHCITCDFVSGRLPSVTSTPTCSPRPGSDGLGSEISHPPPLPPFGIHPTPLPLCAEGEKAGRLTRRPGASTVQLTLQTVGLSGRAIEHERKEHGT